MELNKQEIESTHNKLREIIVSHGNDEYGDCIVDEICFLFGYATTTDIEDEEEPKNVPVLYYTIKNSIGWSRWCDVTGGNHYALKEGYNPKDNEVFYCTPSQAIKLGI